MASGYAVPSKDGAGLVDAQVSGIANDFGVSLRSDGRVIAGVGATSNVSIVSTAGGYNSGAWHHVVFTRAMTSSALLLYGDGVLAVPQGRGSSTASLTSAINLNFGRIQTGNNYFADSLDEIAVYTTVLSGPTVTSHFNAGK